MIQQSHFWVYTLRKWKEDIKEIFAFHVYSHSIYNSQDMQTTQVSIRGRMDKDVMYTHTNSVQSLSRVWLSATPWTTGRQASLSITNTWSLPKLMSIESVMPSSHFILCRPLLLLPSIPPSIRVFSNESALRIRWQHQFSSVPQSRPTLCDPMDCSTPGFSVTISWSLLKLMSIQLGMPSNHLILCHPLLLLPPVFPSIRVFFSESVLHIRWPKYWSFSFSISSFSEYSGLIPLGWTGWIPLQSKGLSRVFFNTTVQKHQFFGTQLSLLSNSHIYTWLLEKP